MYFAQISKNNELYFGDQAIKQEKFHKDEKEFCTIT